MPERGVHCRTRYLPLVVVQQDLWGTTPVYLVSAHTISTAHTWIFIRCIRFDVLCAGIGFRSLRRQFLFLSLLLECLLALGLAHFTCANKTFEADFSRECLEVSARIEQIAFELGL